MFKEIESVFQIRKNMSNSDRQNELQELQVKGNSIVDESLESTRRMIALCEEVRLNHQKKNATLLNELPFVLYKLFFPIFSVQGGWY